MDHVIKMAFMLVLFLFIWLSQEENQAWDTYRMLLKNANNLAVHDAVLNIDKSEQAQGRMVFDEDEAWKTYLETLRLNLGLDSSMNPISGSPLRSSVTVLDFVLIDDSNTTFPILYEHDTYPITRYLKGPAVIAVIETEHPRLVNFSFHHGPIRVPAIFELVPNTN